MKQESLKKISDSIEDYRKETNLLFKENYEHNATEGDMFKLSQQTYYVFDEILKCLKDE